MKRLLPLLCFAACAPASRIDDGSARVSVLPSLTERCATSPAALCAFFDAPACAASEAVTACVEAADVDCLAAQRCSATRPDGGRPFSPGPWGTGIKALAAPFTVATIDGTFDLEADWTGVDSYLFFAHDGTNGAFFAPAALAATLARSPRDVHWFFGWRGATAPSDFDAAREAWLARLDTLPAEERAHWRPRVHFLVESFDQQPSWLAQRFAAPAGTPPEYRAIVPNHGFAIDPLQRIRELGMLGRLTGSGQSAELSFLAHHAQAFAFEAARQRQLDDDGAHVITLAEAQRVHDWLDLDVTLPELTPFDTLEVDLALDCPQHLAGNCGAWDYLSHLWRCVPATGADGGADWQCDQELARWITPYWAEGRWVTDISAQLAALGPGPQHLRFFAQGQWDPRATDYLVSLSLRLRQKQRGARPVALHPLWQGGDWNHTYDALRVPQAVTVPADAQRVELVVLVTGHGGVTGTNCAEFCDHQHLFQVNEAPFLITFPEAQSADTCAERVSEGVVPNQFGTWYFGRGGWCPGWDVAPHVFDVTSAVRRGEANTLTYTTRLDGQPLTEALGGQGNLVLSSWLVVWR